MRGLLPAACLLAPALGYYKPHDGPPAEGDGANRVEEAISAALVTLYPIDASEQTFQLHVGEASSACGPETDITINGFKLNQDENGAGEGTFSSDQGASIQATWSFTCVEWNREAQEQFLAVLVKGVDDVEQEDVGFTIRFQQRAPVWISDVEGAASLYRYRQPEWNEIPEEEPEPETEDNWELDLDFELAHLEMLRGQLADLVDIIRLQEQRLEEEFGWTEGRQDFDQCDSLKCIFKAAYARAREAATGFWGVVGGWNEPESEHGGRRGGPWGHKSPKGPKGPHDHFPHHGNHTHSNGTHPHPPHPPFHPPHHGPPFHPPPFCKCPPPPPHYGPGKHHPPPPPPPAPPRPTSSSHGHGTPPPTPPGHGPPPPPPPHHGPPGGKPPHGGPPREGPPGQEPPMDGPPVGPPPEGPPKDEISSMEGPEEHVPGGHHGPPPPPPPEDERPVYPPGGEHPPPPPHHRGKKGKKPHDGHGDQPPPPPPGQDPKGPPHHGGRPPPPPPPGGAFSTFASSPALAPLKISVCVVVLALIVVALHSRFCAKPKTGRSSRRPHQRGARRAVCRNLFQRIAFWRDSSSASGPETQSMLQARYDDDASDIESVDNMSTTMEQEIAQFRATASVVGDIVAAEEGRSQTRSQFRDLAPADGVRRSRNSSLNAAHETEMQEMQQSGQDGFVSVTLGTTGSRVRVPTDLQVNMTQLPPQHYPDVFGPSSSLFPPHMGSQSLNTGAMSHPQPHSPTSAFPDFVPVDDDSYSLPAYDFNDGPAAAHMITDGVMMNQGSGSSSNAAGSPGSADAFGDAK